jgi:hypothetical protein
MAIPREFKTWFPKSRNCRERVVTVVIVVLATEWKHEEKSCPHWGFSVTDYIKYYILLLMLLT